MRHESNTFSRALLASSCVLWLCGACSSKPSDDDGASGSGSAGIWSPSAGTGFPQAGSGSSGTGVSGTGASGTSADIDAGPPARTCPLTAASIQKNEVDVGINVLSNEDEAALSPLVLSALPTVGARVAFMSDDGKVHVIALDERDKLFGTPAGVSFPAHDFSDLYADDAGGVILLTRDAQGGGTLNCGTPANLCGTPPDPAIACFDMYLMRFNGDQERWATKLTTSSAALPPYSTGKTGADVFMIWWYAHHGRIAFDGSSYASYFGTAISVSEGGCINIHQGDRMQLVGKDGTLGTGGFDLGCSHSGYERIVWDAAASKFVTVCKTDNENRIAFAPDYKTIYPVDLAYSNLGQIVTAADGGYWTTVSNARAGQPANADGLAEVHLLHFKDGAPDKDIVLPADASLNARAPHLVRYGDDHLLAAWETSPKPGDLAADDTERKLYVQSLVAHDGRADGEPVEVGGVHANRYQDLVAFPDGSVAFVAKGSSPTKIRIVRIASCTAP